MNGIESKLISYLKIVLNEDKIFLETLSESQQGDVALPCFKYAKKLKKNPQIIAEEIQSVIENNKPEYIEKIQSVGGYVNFYYNRTMVMENTIKEVLVKGEEYGSSMIGKNKKALIEHTSINPNASPHIGRARNALIGDFLVRLMKFQGYQVETQYFVNDVGKQIAMLVLAGKNKKQVLFKGLLEEYIEINRKMETDPNLEKEVFELLNKLEKGDKGVRELFKNVVDICIKGQTEILKKLGIHYDIFQYESDYIFNNRIDELLETFRRIDRLEEDEHGRLYLDLEDFDLPMKSPSLVLTRNDKTSLYPLRDIAYTIDKVNTNSELNIVVLGEDQKLYFKQICAALQILGYKTPQAVHYSFVLLKEGKMSTRKGTVVLLEDFMQEAVDKAKKYMLRNQQDVDQRTAQAVAYGAVKYAILKVDNNRNVTFDLESALSFEGDTGPYLQYCCARIHSIFNKLQEPLPRDGNLELLVKEEEYELIKELGRFEEIIDKATVEYSSHFLANYIYKLARKFSIFYHQCPVLTCNDEELKAARLLVLKATLQVLTTGMYLLGMDEVQSM